MYTINSRGESRGRVVKKKTKKNDFSFYVSADKLSNISKERISPTNSCPFDLTAIHFFPLISPYMVGATICVLCRSTFEFYNESNCAITAIEFLMKKKNNSIFWTTELEHLCQRIHERLLTSSLVLPRSSNFFFFFYYWQDRLYLKLSYSVGNISLRLFIIRWIDFFHLLIHKIKNVLKYKTTYLSIFFFKSLSPV